MHFKWLLILGSTNNNSAKGRIFGKFTLPLSHNSKKHGDRFQVFPQKSWNLKFLIIFLTSKNEGITAFTVSTLFEGIFQTRKDQTETSLIPLKTDFPRLGLKFGPRKEEKLNTCYNCPCSQLGCSILLASCATSSKARVRKDTSESGAQAPLTWCLGRKVWASSNFLEEYRL